MGFLDVLKGIGKTVAPMALNLVAPGAGSVLSGVMSGVGAATGAASQGMASNRGTQMDALLAQQRQNTDQTRDYNAANIQHGTLAEDQKKRMFDELIARSAEGRASGNDAMRNLTRTSAIMNRDNYQPPVVNGHQLPSFGIAAKGATANERVGAANYQGEVMNRLLNGNPTPMPTAADAIPDVKTQADFQFDPNLMKSGMLEKILGITGAGATAYGAATNGNKSGNRGTATPAGYQL